MAIEVEQLIIQPFREVVERGNEALANAEACQADDADLAARMTTVSRALVREGERALKRLQPLWQTQIEKYGELFTEPIRDNGEYGISSLSIFSICQSSS